MISGYVLDTIDTHAAFNAALDGSLFVAAEIALGFIDEELENGVDASADRLRCGAIVIGNLAHILKQLGGNFLNRQNKVHKAGGDGALDHGIELGGLRILHDHQTTSAAYLSDPESSIRAAA